MPQLNTYLTFDGTCAEAMRFYERTLGGKLAVLMTHAESPMAAQTPPGSADRIMHARLELDGGVLMASDSMAGHPYKGMHGFSLSLVCPTAAEARKLFDALGAGGRVTMPLQKIFWAEAFGMLVDRFGMPWMINGAMAST
jgi:PhnB protein